MENLNLHDSTGNIVHSISRNGSFDFVDLTARLIKACIDQKWLNKMPNAESINDLYFKETYMAGCAKSLWQYYLKNSKK